MRALFLPICVAVLMVLTGAQPAHAQDNFREGRERGRARSGEYERREGGRRDHSGSDQTRSEQRRADRNTEQRHDTVWGRSDDNSEGRDRHEGDYDRRGERRKTRESGGREEGRRGDRGVLEDMFRPRSLNVPKGHYPPPGECRMWYSNRPPGQQPPPVPCHHLHDRRLGGGFIILYGGRAYDTGRDWEEHKRCRPKSLPEAILDIILSGRR